MFRDVYVKDMLTGAVERISQRADGTLADLESRNAVISGDGRYVAFETDATNLLAGDVNGYPDVLVKDRKTGTFTLASTRTDGGQGEFGSFRPSISGDGRFVVFESASTAFLPNGGGGFEVYVKDLHTGALRCVSLNPAGLPSDGESSAGRISEDGRRIAFVSGATDLVAAPDTNAPWVTDVYVARNLLAH